MQIVGVRGSGETANDGDGFGDTVETVIDDVKQQVPTSLAHAVNYPAIKVLYGGINHYAADYKKSEAAGVSNLSTWMDTWFSGPCADQTYVYLVGYSQGAQVVGDYYQALASRNPFRASRIGGVTMLGDPRFRSEQGSPVNVGNYGPSTGVATKLWQFSARTVTGSATGKIRSYCQGTDPICDFTAGNLAYCIAHTNNCPHLFYDTNTYKGQTYTTRAANFLVNRWKKLGPTTGIGPKSNVLIFGDGDTGEGDTSGVDNLTSALTSAGFTVTYSADLPADLSPYGQVWFYGAYDTLEGSGDVQTLVDYAQGGGSLLLTGEWSGCCGNQGNQPGIADIFNQLVLTVGGLQFGDDDDPGAFSVNADAENSVATTPNQLTTMTQDLSGSLSSYNLDPRNILFADTAGNGTVGIFDNQDTLNGERLAIVMDVNWAQTGDGDPNTMPAVTQNLAYFLSGA